jgi:hypothetical protein
MVEWGIWNRIYPLSDWSMRFFSNRKTTPHDIESPRFQVGTNISHDI